MLQILEMQLCFHQNIDVFLYNVLKETNLFKSADTFIKNSISSRLIINSIKLSRHCKIALGRVFTEFKAQLLNEWTTHENCFHMLN